MKLVGQVKMRFFGYFLLFMKKKGGEFLLAIIHSAKRFYACNWRKKQSLIIPSCECCEFQS